jgi:hypothetical protein
MFRMKNRPTSYNDWWRVLKSKALPTANPDPSKCAEMESRVVKQQKHNI